MNINSFAVNEKLELNGVWKELGNGAAIRVARANNPLYAKKLRELMAPYQGPMGLFPIKDDVAERIFAEVISEGILLDWRGLTDEDGRETPYSKEKAIEWILKYKEFRKIVEAVSEDIANYKDAIEKETKEAIKK